MWSPRPANASLATKAWRAPVLLLVCLALLYLATISRSSLSYDVVGANWTSWRLANTGAPWIDGAEIPELDNDAPISVLIVTGANGHTSFGRFPGVVLASLPAYVLWPSSTMTTVPGGVSAAILTALGGVLLFLSLRRHVRSRVAVAGTLAYGLTTPVWTVAANGMWPHTVSLFGITGMAWACSRQRWWLVGAFGGVALCGRLHVALIVAVVGLLLGWQRRDIGIPLRTAVASSAFLGGYCLWVRWVYGTWNPAGAYGDPSGLLERTDTYRFDLVNQAGMWIAPDRGILVWTPVVALLLPALLRSWASLPGWSRALLIAGLAYTVIESALNTFTGGDAFYGYRYGLELLACAAPALVMSIQRAGVIARRAVWPVLGVQLLATAIGAWDDGLILPEAAAWRDNAFVHAVARGGVGGVGLVVLFAVFGVLAGRLWGRLERASVETSAPPVSELVDAVPR